MERTRTTRIKGRVKEAAGWATGDRHVEAEGLVEAETGHEPDRDELRAAEHAVRVAHGDISDETNS